MGVETGCECVETSIERIETRIHPTDERVEPDIDVIQASIDAVEPSIGPRGKRVDPAADAVDPTADAVDPTAEIEECAERHRSKDRQRRPDHSVHLVRERSIAERSACALVADLPNRTDEFPYVQRLRDVPVEARRQEPLAVSVHRLCG